MNEPITPGTQAPDFTLKSSSGDEVTLSQLRGEKVVLAFYPLDWSPGCTRQMDMYTENFDQFEAEGAKIFGVSVDSVYSHRAWADARGISFPLLADFNPKGAVAEAYGVYNPERGNARRAVVVIDPQGIVRDVQIAPPGEIPAVGAVCEVLHNLSAA